MKHLLTIVLTLTLLTCCTTPGRREAMRHGLDSINMRNRADQPFTTADVQPYVDFFDRHGTANDRLLAHYLMGRAYHEQGEAPMALQCYQQAIDCADTTAKDCDYAQMSRVYSQMAEVYYYQWLHTQAIEAYKRAIQYSHLSGDEALMINNYEQMSSAYEAKGEIDSAKWAIDKVITWYDKHGATKYAAISKGRAVSILLNAPCNYTMAHQYIAEYERHSGYFDKEGNIIDGCEIFYYYKALLFMEQNKLDSAEYWFRKELHDGRDFNNQNAGAKGLSQLFLKKNQADSSAKYAFYAYEMNDSAYTKMVTKEIEQISALYNYNRHQKIAIEKTKEAHKEKMYRQLAIVIFFIGLLVLCLIISHLIRKEKRGLSKYRNAMNELSSLRIESNLLRKHDSEYKQLIATKERKIAELESCVSRYGKLTYLKTANAERCLKESKTYQKIAKNAIRGEKLTEEEIKEAIKLTEEYFPGFSDFMAVNTPMLTKNEYLICTFLRLHFKAGEIAGMLKLSKSYLSQISTETMHKLYKQKGSSKELYAKLSKIF